MNVRLRRRLSLASDSAIAAGQALDEGDRAALRRALRALKANAAVALRLGAKYLQARR